jgi:glutathione S-transferase
MKAVLYTFRRCPYAMRARLAIAYTGIDVEQREILLKNKPQVMLDVSPKGTVPVLILKNGQVIDESLAIMLWALRQHDTKGWLVHQQQAMVLIQSNDSQFKPCLDKYKYADRFPEQSQTFYRQQGEVFLQALEKLLAQHTFLLSDEPTLADFAIFPFIRQFAFVNKTWFEQSPYPKLQAWLEYHLQNNLFKKIMVKQPLWMPE